MTKLPKELTTVTQLSKLLAVIVFIALPIVGFFLGVRYQEMLNLVKRQEMEQNLSISRAPTPTPIVDTANWKTYTNVKYKYSIKYPADWEITDVFVPPSPEGIGFTKTTKKNGKYYNHASVNIIIEGNGRRRSSMKQWYLDSIKDLGLGIDTSKYRFKETTFLGYNGVIVNDRKLIFTKDTVNVFRIELIVAGNYDDEFVKYVEQTYNQILSTFKFTKEQEDNQQLGDAATKEECLAKGGVWQKWGLAQLEYCQIPAKDSGKSCTDQSQCAYGCISETGILPGKCAAYKNTFGCFSVVNNGKSEALCAD